MTESKLAALNTHSDTFPINEQLIPYVKDKCEISKEQVIISKKSSWELAHHFMFIALGLFTMTAMIYPVFFLPGLLMIILPIELTVANSIYGRILKMKNGSDVQYDSVSVTDTISDFMVQNQERVSMYGRITPT